MATAGKKLKILKALTVHLEATSGGPSEKVVRGLGVISANYASDKENLISILEAPRGIVGAPAAEGGVKRNEPWTLILQGWPVDDKTHPSDPAYELMDAVETRLAAIISEPSDGTLRTDPTYRLGGLIGSLIIGPGVVRPTEGAASRLAMFLLPLVVEVASDLRT